MKVRSSEILAVANLCISLVLRLELAQARFHSTTLFLKTSCGAVVSTKLFLAVLYNF